MADCYDCGEFMFKPYAKVEIEEKSGRSSGGFSFGGWGGGWNTSRGRSGRKNGSSWRYRQGRTYYKIKKISLCESCYNRRERPKIIAGIIFLAIIVGAVIYYNL
jgi:hypothetical protein